MKKETKKRRILIGISIVIAVLLGLIAVWWFSPEYAPEEIGRILFDHETDYTFAVELYLEDYQTMNGQEYEYGLGYSNGRNGEISCFEDDHVIELTEEETAHMQAIYDSYNSCDRYYFDGQPWDRVYVYDGFVSFSNEKGHKSIVYSQSGEKPPYINAPGETPSFDFSVLKIKDHWYYVRINEWIG